MQQAISHAERIRWFQEARFGMFIHWGLYSIPARGEWVRSREHISKEDYQPYFEEFDPRDYDPAAWARAAKAAGMRYAVLTAKHHDGFCLFDSKLTDYKATNTPAGRDLVREFVDAFRAEGLRVGLYYSLLDWHHEDYPHHGDLTHPMREDPAYGNEGRDFNRYLDYLHGQVRELCENYGQIDLLWFDYSYGELTGEAWRATELVKMVRSLQPGVLIDNRLEGGGGHYGSLMSGEPLFYSGDFICPEQAIPPAPIRDAKGQPVPWEACITMNGRWGYVREDKNFKPAPMLIRMLVDCVSKGGNLLLNVGPDARGRIPAESLAILAEIGRWMDANSDSIYGCGEAGLPKPPYGYITRRGDRLYYHVVEMPIGMLPLHGLKGEQVAALRLLSDGSELELTEGDWTTANFGPRCYAKLGADPTPPDPVATVVLARLKPGALDS